MTGSAALGTAEPEQARSQRVAHGPLLFRGIYIATGAICHGGHEHVLSSALLC